MFKINHDLHNHTGLSVCSSDKSFSAEHIVAHAKECGYDTVCITNHCWDEEIPCTSEFYRLQPLSHIRKALPLPKDDEVKCLWGIETEYCGKEKLGLLPKHFDEFDMIIVPVNHFMKGFTIEDRDYTNGEYFKLQLERLEELLLLDLPWKKIGIAHLTWWEPDEADDVNELLALEDRYFKVFKTLAERGAGIEFNSDTFKWSHPSVKDELEKLPPASRHGKCTSYDKLLWLYSLAKKAGCKFYIGSDSHTHLRLDWPKMYISRIIDDLKLEESDRFFPQKQETL